MSDINPGDIVRVSTTPGFKNSVGALADPTTVTLRWRRHGETETVLTLASGGVIRDSIGLFHVDILVTEPGLHYFRWEGTGAVVAAAESTFSVTSEFIVGVP